MFTQECHFIGKLEHEQLNPCGRGGCKWSCCTQGHDRHFEKKIIMSWNINIQPEADIKYNLKETYDFTTSAPPNSGVHLMMLCSIVPKAVVERKCLAGSFTNAKILHLHWKQIKGPLDIPWMAVMRVELTRSFSQNIVDFPKSSRNSFLHISMTWT